MAALTACAALLTGCVEPVQYGGPIAVDQAGVQARLEAQCGATRQTSGCASLAEPEADGGVADGQ